MLAAAIKRYPVVRLLIDLRVTVVCLALLFVLTFLGTMHQIDNGIYSAQKKYFESFFTLAAGFVPLPGAQLVLWGAVREPGGGDHLPVRLQGEADRHSDYPRRPVRAVLRHVLHPVLLRRSRSCPCWRAKAAT